MKSEDKDLVIFDLQEQLTNERIRLLETQTTLLYFELENIRVKRAEFEKNNEEQST